MVDVASISDAINAQSVILELNDPAAFSGGTTYNIGDFVLSVSIVYRSRTANNQGNTPASSPTNWLAVAPGAGELVLLNDIKYKKTHAITRKNTRAGPLDLFSWAIIEVDFFCSLTEDMATLFDLLNALNDRSNLGSRNYTITGKALLDSAEDVITTFDAKVPDFERLAPAQGDYNARVRLRIKETVPT